MNGTDSWLTTVGPVDGPWLREEFAHITTGLRHVENVRLARLDSHEDMQRYAESVEASQGISGDWEVISPHSGCEYMMGCNWQD